MEFAAVVLAGFKVAVSAEGRQGVLAEFKAVVSVEFRAAVSAGPTEVDWAAVAGEVMMAAIEAAALAGFTEADLAAVMEAPTEEVILGESILEYPVASAFSSITLFSGHLIITGLTIRSRLIMSR